MLNYKAKMGSKEIKEIVPTSCPLIAALYHLCAFTNQRAALPLPLPLFLLPFLPNVMLIKGILLIPDQAKQQTSTERANRKKTASRRY